MCDKIVPDRGTSHVLTVFQIDFFYMTNKMHLFCTKEISRRVEHYRFPYPLSWTVHGKRQATKQTLHQEALASLVYNHR